MTGLTASGYLADMPPATWKGEPAMALNAKQRNKLPASAFAYPKQRKYPVPTPAQAKRAGISAKQNAGLHRNALSRAAQKHTSGSYGAVARKVAARRVVKPGRSRK